MAMQSWRDRLYFAVGEQFTYFNTVQVDGQEVPNETDQYLASSITQLVAGYAFNSRFALQLNVPLIYRSFQRPEGFAIDRGTEYRDWAMSRCSCSRCCFITHPAGGASAFRAGQQIADRRSIMSPILPHRLFY